MSNVNGFEIVNGVLKKYTGSGGDVIIPDDVTEIGNDAFRDCSNLTGVNIPDGVTAIYNYVFLGCSSLASVNIPDSVTYIGENAFYGCKSLTSIAISGSVAEIGHGGVFLGCEGLADENGFVIIRNVLCDYIGSGGDVVIPDGVTEIGGDVFNSCKSLTSITIPDSVTCIDEFAFCDCSSLASVTIPDGVTEIGWSAFSGCESLTSITLPDSVDYIGPGAFYNCSSLTSIAIPDGVSYMDFHGCSSLTDITLSKDETTIYMDAFEGCSSLTDITIPDSVTEIGTAAFKGCSSLTDITIPDSVTKIGTAAFCDCSGLTSITIPKGVTVIQESTFDGCDKLCSLVIENPNCKFEKFAFGRKLPIGLVDEFFDRLTDRELEMYILNSEVWNMLSADTQAKIFFARQRSELTSAYIECTNDSEGLGNAILNRLSAKSPAKECNAAAKFMTMFSQQASAELLQRLYDTMKTIKSAAASLKTIENDDATMRSMKSEAPVKQEASPIQETFEKILQRQNSTTISMEARVKEYYSLKIFEIPKVMCTDETEVPPKIIAWLLTTHETLVRRSYSSSVYDVAAGYEKPGLCPEAEEILKYLDADSLQECLRKVAKENLGIKGRSMKMYLAYPICRYADETLMAELTKMAPSWHSSVSGNNAPPLYTFREANLYSNTRAAMLFAEKYSDLGAYASLRGMTADGIRDQYMSDIGIDEVGAKVYDLGNQVVTARLQADLTFLVELPNGKTAKSMPKKGADEEKYIKACADFSAMKKDAKKIVKNRADVLFQDFLSGRTRPAADWCASYLHNPLLRSVAELLVWSQGDVTFTLNNGQPIDCIEQTYTISDVPIAVAHPMEMARGTVDAWQKYFTKYGIKQPFVQVWEPLADSKTITNNRYKGVMIPYFRFANQGKHGIHVQDEDFHDSITIWFDDCDTMVERIDYARHSIEPTHRFEVTRFKFKTFTRKTNHIVGLLDKWAVYGRILNDDASITEQLPQFTLAQITEFIKLATENNSTNCTAALMEYKNTNFADYDPMAEFTLE